MTDHTTRVAAKLKVKRHTLVSAAGREMTSVDYAVARTAGIGKHRFFTYLRTGRIPPAKGTNVNPSERAALLTLSKDGGWMRRTRIGATKRVLSPLVGRGLVRRHENGRYRITGAGFEALDGAG